MASCEHIELDSLHKDIWITLLFKGFFVFKSSLYAHQGSLFDTKYSKNSTIVKHY